RADEASHPIFVRSNANLGDRATHVIVHPGPAEGIAPVEAGNATGLPLEPLRLFRGNRVWRHAEHEESFASVKDDEVVGYGTVCIEERPSPIRIHRLGSDRREINPLSFPTRRSSDLRADEASHPIFVRSNANLGDRATHVIVHPGPAEGIGPVEAGNAAVAM